MFLSSFRLILCPTDKFTLALEEAFDENGDERISDVEGAMLIFTVAVNPEAAVLRVNI